MRHGKSGRKFSRTTDHRKWLMRNLVTSLLESGRITTTEAKAKELRRHVERLITAAKPDDLAARRHVAAEVTNTGPVAGDEVAQLYVGYRGSRVDRAVRDLKAFARVHLEPGETRTVPFEVRAPDLAYWDAGAGALVVEPIAYTVEVGPSSRDLPLAGAFAVSP